MQNKFTFKDIEYKIKRHPPTENKSLKAWNAADEYVLRYFQELDKKPESIAVYNDRFGFLTVCLNEFSTKTIINFTSQKKAILKNFEANNVSKENLNFIKPLENISEKFELALLKIPKSMELFRLQLKQISASLDENGIVVCGFMTRHFTKQMLTVAEKFFENVEQSLAMKKARLLILEKPKADIEQKIIKEITFKDQTFKQYFGVFSSKHIDFASQFLIRNLNVDQNQKRVLDLASGNGVLAKFVQFKNPNCEMHLLEDDWLALESSKMNFENIENVHFYFADSLDKFKDGFFDLIVCNPPFHFDFENNIEVAIGLFDQARRCLEKNGSFQIVANRHLNYNTHLIKLFDEVNLVKRNKRFEIYDCKLPKNF